MIVTQWYYIYPRILKDRYQHIIYKWPKDLVGGRYAVHLLVCTYCVVTIYSGFPVGERWGLRLWLIVTLPWDNFIGFLIKLKALIEDIERSLISAHGNHYVCRSITKSTKWHVRPSKTHFSLGIRPVWSEPSLSAWRKHESLATHLAHSEDWADAQAELSLRWGTCHFVVVVFFSWGGSCLFFATISVSVRKVFVRKVFVRKVNSNKSNSI